MLDNALVKYVQNIMVSNIYFDTVTNQNSDSTGWSIALSVGWKNSPERGFKTVSFNL